MFYNCGGERQTFACRLLTPINAGLPPSSEGLPLSCEGPSPSSVLLPPCFLVRRGTRKRRHQVDRPTLRDGRPTLWDGRPTLCEGRPALRDAIGRHSALWDGRPTLCEGRPALRDAIGQHNYANFNLSRHGDISQSNAVNGTDSEWRCGPFYTLRHTTPSSGAVL